MRELKYSILKTEGEIIFLLEKDDFFNIDFEYDCKGNSIFFISEKETVFVCLGKYKKDNAELKFFITDEKSESIIAEFEII